MHHNCNPSLVNSNLEESGAKKLLSRVSTGAYQPFFSHATKSGNIAKTRHHHIDKENSPQLPIYQTNTFHDLPCAVIENTVLEACLEVAGNRSNFFLSLLLRECIVRVLSVQAEIHEYILKAFGKGGEFLRAHERGLVEVDRVAVNVGPGNHS